MSITKNSKDMSKKFWQTLAEKFSASLQPSWLVTQVHSLINTRIWEET